MLALAILHFKKWGKVYLALALIALIALGCRFFYQAGKVAATAEYLNSQLDELTLKNAALVQAQKDILRLQSERDTAQLALAQKEKDITDKAQGEINEIQETQEDVIAKLRTTIAGMSDDMRVREAESATSKLAASVLADYARGQAKLSESAIRFLVREADRGDQCSVTLTACQDLHRLRESEVLKYNQKYFGVDFKF